MGSHRYSCFIDAPTPAPGTTRYSIPIDLTNEGDSRARVLHMVRPARTVLELGASVGLMTEIMHDWGIAVTAVEIDPEAEPILRGVAARVVIGDLDDPQTLKPLGDEQFDVVLASDVLEHLKDPLRCLRQAVHHMKPDGRVIVSIPNFAHADVRLALLAGDFDYRDMGLLDRTHIKFFTRSSLETFLRDAGLEPIVWDRTERAIGGTEVPVPPTLVEWGQRVLASDPDADTYQWLVECRRSTGAAHDTPTVENQARAAIVGAIAETIAVPAVTTAPAPSFARKVLRIARRITRRVVARVTSRRR